MFEPVIDTHVHIWDLAKAEYPWLKNDRSILNRSYSLPELEPERLQANVIAGVLVQAAGNMEDTELMLEAAKQTGWIKGVVAWLPLRDSERSHQLLQEKFLPEKYFSGVRHQIHDEKDSRWLLQPAVIESLQLLAAHDKPYDIVGTLPDHIETAISVAGKVPGLRMVFDHLNQPPVASKEKFGPWGERMKVAAQYPFMYAKISGLGTTTGNYSGWLAGDLQPYIEFVLEHFGIDRCFFGGDWPVSLLAGSYTNTWQSYQQVAEKLLNEEERKKVFYTNAKLFYNLEM
jgi:L-fuconolactonase